MQGGEDMSKSSEKRKERAAYHEAGHAVLDILMGLPFTEVSLRTMQKDMKQAINGKMEDVIHIVTTGVVWPMERTESANAGAFDGKLDLREAVCSMAGPVAEAMFVGDIDDTAKFGAQNDVNGIQAVCRAAISPGLPFEKWKESVMEEHIVKAAHLQAFEILQEHWECIEAVAQALLKHRSLTYEQAKAIVDRKKGG
jgi:hypothetical protein